MSNRITFNYDEWQANQGSYKVVTRDGDEVIRLHSFSEKEMIYGIVNHDNAFGDMIEAHIWDLKGRFEIDDNDNDLFLIPIAPFEEPFADPEPLVHPKDYSPLGG